MVIARTHHQRGKKGVDGSPKEPGPVRSHIVADPLIHRDDAGEAAGSGQHARHELKMNVSILTAPELDRPISPSDALEETGARVLHGAAEAKQSRDRIAEGCPAAE